MLSITQLFVIGCVGVLAATAVLAKDAGPGYNKEKDMMRKSIVYDKKTPNVFYCPISKPTGMDKLIVKCVCVWWWSHSIWITMNEWRSLQGPAAQQAVRTRG